jgi:hypothetical protein
MQERERERHLFLKTAGEISSESWVVGDGGKKVAAELASGHKVYNFAVREKAIKNGAESRVSGHRGKNRNGNRFRTQMPKIFS